MYQKEEGFGSSVRLERKISKNFGNNFQKSVRLGRKDIGSNSWYFLKHV